MKRLPGLKTYKTVKEALSAVAKECEALHGDALEKIVKGNSDLIKGVSSGTVQKGTR